MIVDAFRRLRRRPDTDGVRLAAAGYLPPEHQEYLDAARRTLADAGLAADFEYRGEVDRAGKIAFFGDVDVLSVPATYHEPKGMFLMEAMAAGVPVVQPRVGAFPEIVERTGGGLIVDTDADALADGILALQRDPALAQSLGRAGADGVREHYTVERMADQVEAIYGDVARTRNAPAPHGASRTC